MFANKISQLMLLVALVALVAQQALASDPGDIECPDGARLVQKLGTADCEHSICGASTYASTLMRLNGNVRCCCFKSWLIKAKANMGKPLSDSERTH